MKWKLSAVGDHRKRELISAKLNLDRSCGYSAEPNVLTIIYAARGRSCWDESLSLYCNVYNRTSSLDVSVCSIARMPFDSARIILGGSARVAPKHLWLRSTCLHVHVAVEETVPPGCNFDNCGKIRHPDRPQLQLPSQIERSAETRKRTLALDRF